MRSNASTKDFKVTNVGVSSHTRKQYIEPSQEEKVSFNLESECKAIDQELEEVFK